MATETVSKGYKVPKIKRGETKDNLRSVDVESRDAKDVLQIVEHSYVETRYKSKWQLKGLQFIENKYLDESYREKRQEMKDDGRRDRELTEHYAFLLYRDNKIVPTVAKHGLHTRSLPFNALGDSKLGVYLCRNADVQLRLAEGWGIQSCTVILFKITLGKCKSIGGPGISDGDGMEPTPNYDCHMAQTPSPSDPIHIQLAKSQLYLYEYTDECVPSKRPRQCLPYAVLYYEKVEIPVSAPSSLKTEQSQVTDSYNKKPNQPTAPQDSKDINPKDPKLNPSDPRFPESRDPRLGQGTSSLVPHLSDPRLKVASSSPVYPQEPAYPPDTDLRLDISDTGAYAFDPRLLDPGFKLNPSYSDSSGSSAYVPSFGPSEEEMIEKKKEQAANNVLLTEMSPENITVSLPPLDLPTQPLDTRLRNPRLQKDVPSQIPEHKNKPNPSRSSANTKSNIKTDESLGKMKRKLSLNEYKKKVTPPSVLEKIPQETVSESSIISTAPALVKPNYYQDSLTASTNTPSGTSGIGPGIYSGHQTGKSYQGIYAEYQKLASKTPLDPRIRQTVATQGVSGNSTQQKTLGTKVPSDPRLQRHTQVVTDTTHENVALLGNRPPSDPRLHRQVGSSRVVTREAQEHSLLANKPPSDPRLRRQEGSSNMVTTDAKQHSVLANKTPSDPRLQRQTISLQPTQPQKLDKAAQPQQLAKAAQPQQLVTAAQPQHLVKASQPQQLVKASQPQQLVKASQPQQLVKASQPQQLVKASQPQQLVKASQPQQLVKASQPQQLIKASQPQQLVKASPVISHETNLIQRAEFQPSNTIDSSKAMFEELEQSIEMIDEPEIIKIAQESEDMLKTLSELPDPDEVSQSPKHDAVDDPSIAAIIDKLVEQNPEMSVITLAIKQLEEQPGMSEFTQSLKKALTDPETVKTLLSLTGKQEGTVSETVSETKTEREPESEHESEHESEPESEPEIIWIQSPEPMTTMPITIDEMKNIPIDDNSMTVAYKTSDLSPLSKAMRKTLAELPHVNEEESVTTFMTNKEISSKDEFKGEQFDYKTEKDVLKGECFSYETGNVCKKKVDNANDTVETMKNIANIPIPPPILKANDQSRNITNINDIPLPRSESKPESIKPIITKGKIVSDTIFTKSGTNVSTPESRSRKSRFEPPHARKCVPETQTSEGIKRMSDTHVTTQNNAQECTTVSTNSKTAASEMKAFDPYEVPSERHFLLSETSKFKPRQLSLKSGLSETGSIKTMHESSSLDPNIKPHENKTAENKSKCEPEAKTSELERFKSEARTHKHEPSREVSNRRQSKAVTRSTNVPDKSAASKFKHTTIEVGAFIPETGIVKMDIDDVKEEYSDMAGASSQIFSVESPSSPNEKKFVPFHLGKPSKKHHLQTNQIKKDTVSPEKVTHSLVSPPDSRLTRQEKKISFKFISGPSNIACDKDEVNMMLSNKRQLLQDKDNVIAETMIDKDHRIAETIKMDNDYRIREMMLDQVHRIPEPIKDNKAVETTLDVDHRIGHANMLDKDHRVVETIADKDHRVSKSVLDKDERFATVFDKSHMITDAVVDIPTVLDKDHRNTAILDKDHRVFETIEDKDHRKKSVLDKDERFAAVFDKNNMADAMLDIPTVLDQDHRNTEAILDKEHRVARRAMLNKDNGISEPEKMGGDKHVQNDMLDKDHRQRETWVKKDKGIKLITDKITVNTGVVLDNNVKPMNMVEKLVEICPSLYDKDERKSHSRSISPVQSITGIKQLGIGEIPNKREPNEFDKNKKISHDTGNRKSTSETPSDIEHDTFIKSEVSTRDNSGDLKHISTDMNKVFRDKSLDSTTVANDKAETDQTSQAVDVDLRQGPAENEFGDVDWRQAAAAEMGDVDLRSQSHHQMDFNIQKTQTENINLGPSPFTMNSNWRMSEPSRNQDIYSYRTAGPPKPAPPQAYEQYHTETNRPPVPAGSFKTHQPSVSYNASPLQADVSSYSSTGVTSSTYGEYRTTDNAQLPMSMPYSYSTTTGSYNAYSTSASDQQDGFNIQNVIKNLDLYNLKNILAKVQGPPAPTPITTPPKVEKIPGLMDDVDDDDDDSQNMPAFVTGLQAYIPKKKQNQNLRRSSGVAMPLNKEDAPSHQHDLADHRMGGFSPSGKVNSGSEMGSPEKGRFDHQRFGHGDGPDNLVDKPHSGLGPGSDLGMSGEAIVGPGIENPLEMQLDKQSEGPLKSGDNVQSTFNSSTDNTKNMSAESFSIEPKKELSTNVFEPLKINANDIFAEHISKNTYSDTCDPVSKVEATNTSPKDDNSDSEDGHVKRDKNKKGKSKSPRKRSSDSFSVTPENKSWQTAILESMEQSELKVRHDSDSEEEPPTRIVPKKSLFESYSTPDKKGHITSEEGFSSEKRQRCDSSDGETDDEDSFSLVIDLSRDDGKGTPLSSSRGQQKKQNSTPLLKVKARSSTTDNVKEPVEKKMRIENSDDKESKPEWDDTLVDLTEETESVTEDRNSGGTPTKDEISDDEETAENDTAEQKDDVMDNELQIDEHIPESSFKMKEELENRRKKMVISLKGEKKKVNPLTGKVYTADFGPPSSIPVLGQQPPNKSACLANNSGNTIPVLGQCIKSNYRSPSPMQTKHSSISTVTSVSSSIHPNQSHKIQTIGTVGSKPGTRTDQRDRKKPPYPVSPDHSSTITTIKTIGKGVSHTKPQIKTERKSSTGDVLDWFSEQFEPKKQPECTSPLVEADSTEPLIKCDDISNTSISTVDGGGPVKKRVLDNAGELTGSKKQKTSVTDIYREISDTSQNRTVRIVQSDPPKTMTTDSPENSDLEEGEIVDDSSVTSSPPREENSRRVVVQENMGSNIPVVGFSSNLSQRLKPLRPELPPDSPKRIVQKVHQSYNPIQTQIMGQSSRTSRQNWAATDWSDMIQNTRIVKNIETIQSCRRSKSSERSSRMSQRSSSGDGTGDMPSAVTSKNNSLGRNPVKTLEDWLRFELEVENIKPLEKYLPYPVNTDLSSIPKSRRNNIKMKVRSIMESEEFRADANVEPPSTTVSSVVTISISLPETSKQAKVSPTALTSVPIVLPSYSPEISSNQIERELDMVKKCGEFLRGKTDDASAVPVCNPINGIRFAKTHIPGSHQELQLLTSLTAVEIEMKGMLQRTCFYGYPHRRVPKELLLSSEANAFKSPEEDVFLILMMPISTKPYHKLITLKLDIETLQQEFDLASGSDDILQIDKQLKQLHIQRQGLLKAFTGFLNKKRITKLQDQVNKFTLVYDFFKTQRPPTSDACLKFIRTTQMDLRQHLLLSKQYLAMMEEQLNRGK